MSSYVMDESFTYEADKTGVYYTSSNFTNLPLFTEQELYSFLPAEQSIYQNENEVRVAVEGENAGYWMQDYTRSKPSMGVYPQFSGMEGYFMGNGIVPVQDCYSMGMQDGYMSADEDAFSCQPSPFLAQQYPRPSFMDHTQSPITPSGSPLAPEHSMGFYNSAPSFLLASGYENDEEYGYQVPMSCSSFAAPLPSSQTPPLASDSSCMSSPALGSPGSDDDDEEEEYGNDLSLLPQQGNKELRGMGLYDSPPDLLYTNCSTPAGCSPITPHNTLGKGLVLERSFGLPEEMMMKDESSGKIVKGKFEMEEEEEEPMMYEDESGEWDGAYQDTYPQQYGEVAFYAAQINREW